MAGRMRWPAVGLLVPIAILSLPGTSWAADGQIDQIDTGSGQVEVLFSLRDLPAGGTADLASVKATVDGDVEAAEAELASNAASVERVTMLTIDVSNSMAGDRFTQAKAAAVAFLDQAPDDVLVGLTTFASGTEVVAAPTTDRDEIRAAISDLSLSPETDLYAGVKTAVEALPADTQNSLLVLSDGKDTSGAAVAPLLEQVRRSGARVDVVALEQSGTALRTLESIAGAGGGEAINADDPSALTAVFEQQAEVLASQVLVTFSVPDGWDGGGASVAVSLRADGETYTDETFVAIPALPTAGTSPDPSAAGPIPVEDPFFSVSRPMMLGGLGGLALGCALLGLLMTGTFTSRKQATLDDRLSPYANGGKHSPAGHSASGPGPGVVQQAVDVTERVLRGRSLDAKLAQKLEAGGLKLHAAEWLLLHAGIAFGAAFVGYAVSGRILMTVVAFAAGLVLPYLYLTRKARKRIKNFGSQLADTLQLISGSLSAGLSMVQSLDTVVREGQEPVSSEFRRALVEQRLGVDIEAALDGVAQRMGSDDFAWVVMAIRIQREVGGNLAELLLTVAKTLREREYLRRQVNTLSAEGRLSAWILGGLPPGFFVYLMLVRPEYLEPMLATTLGWMMLGAATVMMALGTVVLRKVVKVEV